MRRIAIAAIAGSAFLTGVVAANAADMAVKARPMAPPAFSWTGFYIGANIGGAWTPGTGTSDFGPLFPPFIVLAPQAAIPTLIPGQLASLTGGGSNSGVIGGGQIGYNWQVNQVVLGVEADVVGTGLKGSSATATRSFGPPILLATVNQTVNVEFGHIDWMATFRGRLGFAADRALFYVTGGAAVAGIGGSTTTLINGPASRFRLEHSPPTTAARPRAGAGPWVAASNGRSTRIGAWRANIVTPISATEAATSTFPAGFPPPRFSLLEQQIRG
jgi:outer membrane immunogenic protein